eukprot:15461517-Alexandrium_andersonii.AAC.1
MASSVLIVPGTKHARLEDTSPEEPSVCLRSHSFWVEGKLAQSKAGDKVGGLGCTWETSAGRTLSCSQEGRSGSGFSQRLRRT